MPTQKEIRQAFERIGDTYRKRPSAAHSQSCTTVRLTSGLTCEVEDGKWRLVGDQPPTKGGADLGPDPGVLGRAALGICAAQGYAKWFAALGLPLRAIEVKIETEMDGRGFLALDDAVPAGYQAVRTRVTIESDADETAIIEALDKADRHSPWQHNFETALPVTREVTIKRPGQRPGKRPGR